MTTELTDVTITADADIVRRIELNEVQVVAVVHLSERDIQSRLDSTPFSYFVVLVSDGNGGTRGEQVKVAPSDTAKPNLVHLQITELPEP